MLCMASPALLFLLLLPPLTPAPGAGDGGRTRMDGGGEGLIPPPPLVTDQPYFDPCMPTNVTAHVGRRAELPCRVHSIGNKTVAWIRRRDLRIMAVGRYTYTTDLRYEVLHQEDTNQWTLRIKYVQPRDQGTYECQISTKPPKTFTVHLNVLEHRGEILGAPELFVHQGSRINLTCILHNLPEAPEDVLWSHENKSITYTSSRGGVSVLLEKGPTTTSRLLLTSATPQDSGTYTCAPDGLSPTSIRVHVIHAEEPAAMHKNNTALLPPQSDGRAFAATNNSAAAIGGERATATTFLSVVLRALLQVLGLRDR